MIVVMQPGATEEQIQTVIDRLVALGFDIHRSTGVERTVLGCIGVTPEFDPRDVEILDGVAEAHRISAPYKLVGRHFRPEGTVVRAGSLIVGAEEVAIIAGPCSVENHDQIFAVAEIVAAQGAQGLRGGAFKPRTSPYSFQGMGEEGLKLLRAACDRYGLVAVSEVMSETQIPLMLDYVDVLQVGARNMQNFNLLRELGKVRRPILLKRGIAATIEELLLSAEYVMAGGNYDVILCERGIRTFESYTRNTLDLSAIPVVKKLSHLPIVADPSHGTGRRDQVPPMARAAVAAGADGVLMEVHNNPDHALSDGAQSLFPQQYTELMAELRMIARAVHRNVAGPRVVAAPPKSAEPAAIATGRLR
jgi:3-deoxy-7-phosphoheptulonate synthase